MALTKVTQHSLGNSAVTTAKLGTAPFGFANSSANVVYMAANGNVGIGTSTPSSKLHITGGQQYITGATSAGAYTRWYNNAQTTGDLQVGQGWSTGSDNIGFILNNSNADLLLCTNGIDRMRVAANGFVGIGTTSPTETFTSVGRRGMSRPTDTTRRTIEFHTVISASTSNADLYQVDISNLNQSFYYEIIINGSDWSGHSAARAIKRGFHCPNGSYSPHSVVESSGTFGANIIYDYGQNSNVFTGKLRLDEGTVSLHCYVRLIGRINSYTVYGTE